MDNNDLINDLLDLLHIGNKYADCIEQHKDRLEWQYNPRLNEYLDKFDEFLDITGNFMDRLSKVTAMLQHNNNE